MKNHSEIAAIGQTFAAAETPPNVAAAAWFARRPLLRRFRSRALSSGLFSTEGRFTYRAGGQEHLIKYDARNLQFRALYDPAYRHGYELETGLLMGRLCRGRGAFWDVGANWGYFSLLAASFPEFQGNIFAFEPNLNTFQDLVSTVEQAGLSERIRALNQGVSSEAGEMVVEEIDRFNTGLSQLSKEGVGPRVPVVTLDSIESDHPLFIKVDAEGMEFDILRGSTTTMARSRPFIVFENFLDHDVVKTCAPLEFLRSHDYRIFVPVLRFRMQGRIIAVSYGHDYNPLLAVDPNPVLCLHELDDRERFLLGSQLNLFGVHSERVEELWDSGIQKISA